MEVNHEVKVLDAGIQQQRSRPRQLRRREAPWGSEAPPTRPGAQRGGPKKPASMRRAHEQKRASRPAAGTRGTTATARSRGKLEFRNLKPGTKPWSLEARPGRRCAGGFGWRGGADTNDHLNRSKRREGRAESRWRAQSPPHRMKQHARKAEAFRYRRRRLNDCVVQLRPSPSGLPPFAPVPTFRDHPCPSAVSAVHFLPVSSLRSPRSWRLNQSEVCGSSPSPVLRLCVLCA